MLNDLEIISNLYLEQKTPFLNGSIGNPFAKYKDGYYVLGIMINNYNPLAIYNRLNCTSLYWCYGAFEKYFEYLTRRHTYQEMVKSILIHEESEYIKTCDMMSSRSDYKYEWRFRYIKVLLDKFPKEYGNTCTTFFKYIPRNYYNNVNLLNIANENVCKFIRLGFGQYVINALTKHIKSHRYNKCDNIGLGQSPNAILLKFAYERIGLGEEGYFGAVLQIIKNHGNLSDVGEFESVIARFASKRESFKHYKPSKFRNIVLEKHLPV